MLSCVACGGDDHVVKNCPVMKPNLVGLPVKNERCFYCRTNGHSQFECLHNKYRGQDCCNWCGQAGHKRSDCPERGTDLKIRDQQVADIKALAKRSMLHPTVWINPKRIDDDQTIYEIQPRGKRLLDKRNLKCGNCGGKSHTSLECVGSHGYLICTNCLGLGHENLVYKWQKYFKGMEASWKGSTVSLVLNWHRLLAVEKKAGFKQLLEINTLLEAPRILVASYKIIVLNRSPKVALEERGYRAESRKLAYGKQVQEMVKDGLKLPPFAHAFLETCEYVSHKDLGPPARRKKKTKRASEEQVLQGQGIPEDQDNNPLESLDSSEEQYFIDENVEEGEI